MECSSIKKIYDIILPNFQVDDHMSRRRTLQSPNTVEMMLHCLLWWLGDESNLDIRQCVGIFPTEFHGCMYKGIDEILHSDELSYEFPSNGKELNAATQVFW